MQWQMKKNMIFLVTIIVSYTAYLLSKALNPQMAVLLLIVHKGAVMLSVAVNKSLPPSQQQQHKIHSTSVIVLVTSTHACNTALDL